MAAHSLIPGQTLGHFRLVEKIGAGGMGTVYRAWDMQLERDVAVKVLKNRSDSVSERRRLRKEAVALSRLNHPNIESIYSIESDGDIDFLVFELLSGCTLADRIHGPLDKASIVTFGVQIAGAVAAAHQNGVIHRDLKPENIFLTKECGVKVLDFGLARMAVIANDESTKSVEQQGTLAGTLAYMAPEQIDPGVDDERSDIYSLGAVLYVMASGQRPFGHTAIVRLIEAILHEQPVPPCTQNPGLAPELERIILKCLDKNPDARYQSAREIAIELKTLLPQGVLGPSDSRTIPEEKGRRYKRLLVLGVIAAAFVILVTGFLLYRAASTRNARTGHEVQRSNATATSSRMRTVPLTSLPGWVQYPAFSPDAEKIAFIWNGENPIRGDLYVQLVGGERPLRLTHTDHGVVCCANWSPDGQKIAFGRCDDNGGGVFVVPALGGTERKLTDVICPFGDSGYPKWTADGKSLVLADRCVPDGPRGIVLFSLETGEKRCLTAPPLYSEQGDFAPALSPDGKSVAFLRSLTGGVPEIYTIALSGGKLRQLTAEGTTIWDPMWSSDGQHIIFNSARSGLSRVWRIPAAGGAIEPETVYPGTGTLSRDGRRLAYVDSPGFYQGSVVISRVALSSAGGQVVSQNRIIASDRENNAPQLSANGQQIIFQSGRTGRYEIWRSDADGSNPLQMTFFDTGFSGTPRWSPDGRWIAFDHHETHSQIYLIDSEGRNMHAITSGNYENVVPGWSRDGKAVYFASNRTGSWQVWRRELATGREAQVTHHGAFAAFESYDAKTLYYSRFEGGGIWSMPVGGGEEQRVTEALHRGFWGHFAVTVAGIYLLDSDAAPKPTIMFYSFQTRLLTPVLQLEEDPVPWMANLAASRDGRTVFFAQGNWHNSLTMAENFQ
jgi:Tol biopolymer transport system component/serine/threonine protein kinase